MDSDVFVGNFWVTDVTGKVTKSNSTTLSRSEYNTISEILQKIKNLDYFKLSVSNSSVYFSPDKIVSISSRFKKKQPWWKFFKN